MMLFSYNKNLSELMELEKKIGQLEDYIQRNQIELELESFLQKVFEDFSIK